MSGLRLVLGRRRRDTLTCPGAQSCLWLRELRHRGDRTAMIRAYDFLEHGLRFMEERFNTPGSHASVGGA
jgi:hypothetical protein